MIEPVRRTARDPRSGGAQRERPLPWRRAARRGALSLIGALASVLLLADVAGASVVTYWSGYRTTGTWYAVNGYWSYYGNEVSGPTGPTYQAGMVRSNGEWVSWGAGANYIYIGNNSGYYVSPRCAQTSSGTVNFWCKAYY
ncbi:MAG: hypothetical protein ACKV2O_00560 [Acidimicrobiales bacterium]